MELMYSVLVYTKPVAIDPEVAVTLVAAVAAVETSPLASAR
jgi:hypothetical protein